MNEDVIVLISVFASILFGLIIYLLPTLIAANRKHRNTASIAILNLFLGWTFLGWVAALVWAFTDNTNKSDEITYLSNEDYEKAIKMGANLKNNPKFKREPKFQNPPKRGE